MNDILKINLKSKSHIFVYLIIKSIILKYDHCLIVGVSEQQYNCLSNMIENTVQTYNNTSYTTRVPLSVTGAFNYCRFILSS